MFPGERKVCLHVSVCGKTAKQCNSDSANSSSSDSEGEVNPKPNVEEQKAEPPEKRSV